ncbi:MAG TPA: MFS transporter [Acidobacteriota bacterium]|nr:MFS transporter [Acidobacteriota bacterium]
MKHIATDSTPAGHHGQNASPAQAGTRTHLQLINLESAFATFFVVFSGGAFLTGLGLYFGASDFQLGLLTAIPFIAQAAQLLSAYIVERTGHRKAITEISLLVGRQAWWVLIPLLAWQMGGFYSFLLVVAVSNAAVMLATPTWLAWTADLVPASLRGRYFATRNTAVALATVVATVAGGVILDYLPSDGDHRWGFMVICALAALCSLAASALRHRLPDRPRTSPRRSAARTSLWEPLRSESFRRLLTTFVSWNIAIGISAAFFTAHMLINLKMSFLQIALYSSAVALVSVAANRPWGAIIDRYGCRSVVVFCAFGLALIPLIWWIPRAGSLWILIPEAVYSGIFWAGFNLAAFTIPIDQSPAHKRTPYLAVFAVVTGLAFFIASVAGGILAERLVDFRWVIGDRTIIGYHLLFALSAFLRLVTGFVALRLQEPRVQEVPLLMQFVGYATLWRLGSARQIFPLGVRRKVRRPPRPPAGEK